jgi:hypothetical protein
MQAAGNLQEAKIVCTTEKDVAERCLFDDFEAMLSNPGRRRVGNRHG